MEVQVPLHIYDVIPDEPERKPEAEVRSNGYEIIDFSLDELLISDDNCGEATCSVDFCI